MALSWQFSEGLVFLRAIKPLHRSVMAPLNQRTLVIVFSGILLSFAQFVHPTTSLAMGTGSCWGIAAGETFVPGLGFGLSGQFGKMAVIGGGRWAADRKYYKLIEEPDYQKKSTDIYVTVDAEKSPSGKAETDVYLNKSTYEAGFYGSLSGNLWMISLGDLYRNNCESSNETLKLSFSPLRFDHFYDNWMFWLPVAVLAANNATYGDTNISRYHLGNGLKEKQLKEDGWKQYYMVGFGEEMFFRGTVMQSMYSGLTGGMHFSAGGARHLSVVGSSAVFAVAHNGAGFTATPAIAFASGVYLGYAYMPNPGEEDLMTAIAIHSWWDIMVSYTILNNSTYTSSDSKVEIPLLSFAGQF